MTLSIIIVNYRTASLTIDCVASIATERSGGESINVVLVDNASPDDSANVLAQAIEQNGWEHWVKFIPAAVNAGFACGNNLGIRFALNAPSPPEYLLLLNPDTIVRRGALSRLCRFMEEHPKAGIAGAYIVGKEGVPLHSAHRFPSPVQQFVEGFRLGIVSRWLGAVSLSPGSSKNVECDWVSGACMLVRRQVFEQVGEMDEEYFLYFEEVDYCRRAKSALWQVWYVADAIVVHLVGASTDVNASGKRRPMYWYESRLRYFRKHHGRFGAILADAACCLGVWGFRARNFVKRNNSLTPQAYLRDIFRCRLGWK
jgi:N-acetylglucosaminyl-diphospho-decaprenol L-rhamnosyltransferase